VPLSKIQSDVLRLLASQRDSENAGAVLDAIDAAGIKENTIVVRTSDNGPETHIGNNIAYGATSDSGPFRVPYMASLKGHPNIKPGAEGPSETEPSNPNKEIPRLDGKD
jgi:hypothetical protein